MLVDACFLSGVGAGWIRGDVCHCGIPVTIPIPREKLSHPQNLTILTSSYIVIHVLCKKDRNYLSVLIVAEYVCLCTHRAGSLAVPRGGCTFSRITQHLLCATPRERYKHLLCVFMRPPSTTPLAHPPYGVLDVLQVNRFPQVRLTRKLRKLTQNVSSRHVMVRILVCT